MAEDMLEILRAIDLEILVDIVRQDQQSIAFEILDWTVKRLSDKGIMNPDGLFVFSGQGRDEQGTRPWAVVLKTLKDPGGEPNIGNIFYWKRELLLIQSELMAKLPGAVAVPRFYATMEREDGAWIWMEYIRERVNPHWRMEQYVFAAHQVGRFNASCLTLSPMPDFPWLCKSHVRDWLAVMERFHDWNNAFVSKAFSSELRERVNKLWDERERFLNTLEGLPQVFSHFDFGRRNLFIRQQPNGREELVAIDWALCGYGALGGDIVAFIGDNMLIFEVEPAAAPDLETAVFAAYLEGLRDGGWQGDVELVRLAYTARTALYFGVAAPALVVIWTGDYEVALQLFGRSPDELALGWASMCAFALDRADEARQLMDRLGF